MEWQYQQNKNRVGSIMSESWTTGTSYIQATIVKGHIHYPDGFVLHCFGLGIDTREIKAINETEAMSKAEIMLREVIDERKSEYDKFLS